MSDNTIIQEPSIAGDTISTEDIGGGVKLPRSKMVIGVHGTDSGDVSTSNPMPITAPSAIPITTSSPLEITASSPLSVMLSSINSSVASGTALPVNIVNSEPLPTNAVPVIITSSDTAASGGNQGINYAQTTNIQHSIHGVAWSYSGGNPTSGYLTITDTSNSTIVFQIDITSQGPGFVPFNPPLTTGCGHGMLVYLNGGGQTAKLNVLGHIATVCSMA
jgi:hypothetical protein